MAYKTLADMSGLLLHKMSQIEGIKCVDLYYSQEEKILNVAKCPAILFNVSSIRWEPVTLTKDNRITEYGINLYLLSAEGNQVKEMDTQRMLHQIYKALKPIPDIKVKSSECIVREANLTIYATTIEHTEQEVL